KEKHADATVTICHSRTRDMKAHCRRADILIAAMGVAEFVKADMVKPGAVVVDVGVNRVADPKAGNGYRLVGDVDFAAVQRLAGPDQTTVMRKSEMKFALQDALLHSTNVTVFGQVEFKTAGTYFVEVLVDDVMKLRFPVSVMVAPPPNPNQPPPQSAPTA